VYLRTSNGRRSGPALCLHVIFAWLAERRRKRILETPFPQAWARILQQNMAHFAYLDAGERQRLCDLIQLFIHEKDWEGCGGLELSDEIRVTIAGQACLLILNLDHVSYANVETILVYPSTFIPRRVEEPMFASGSIVPDVVPLAGEAHRRGPVILTWDAVQKSGRHPELGHNVVYHELAHKLDMLDGAVDGVPPLQDRQEYARWNEVFKSEYTRLRELSESGREGLLDPYGSTNEAEFFAVVTEAFFDSGLELSKQHPALYGVVSAFYRQDTAERERRARERRNSTPA
jgi:Mlc titration factor MtfA (ptsG expression regulator)